MTGCLTLACLYFYILPSSPSTSSFQESWSVTPPQLSSPRFSGVSLLFPRPDISFLLVERIQGKLNHGLASSLFQTTSQCLVKGHGIFYLLSLLFWKCAISSPCNLHRTEVLGLLTPVCVLWHQEQFLAWQVELTVACPSGAES